MKVFFDERLIAFKAVADDDEAPEAVAGLCLRAKDFRIACDDFFKGMPTGTRSVTLRNYYRGL